MPCKRRSSGGLMVRTAVLLLVLCLAGCGSGAQDPVWQTVQQALSRAGATDHARQTVPMQQETIRRAVAAQSPAEPLLMMTLPDRGAVATLVVLEKVGGITTWVDATGITITLEGGVVRETRGLGDDLMASDISGLHAARAGNGPENYTRVMRWLSANGVLTRTEWDCRAESGPGRIIERCDGETRLENWYATQGRASSRQWLGPSLGYLYIERLN